MWQSRKRSATNPVYICVLTLLSSLSGINGLPLESTHTIKFPLAFWIRKQVCFSNRSSKDKCLKTYCVMWQCGWVIVRRIITIFGDLDSAFAGCNGQSRKCYCVLPRWVETVFAVHYFIRKSTCILKISAAYQRSTKLFEIWKWVWMWSFEEELGKKKVNVN